MRDGVLVVFFSVMGHFLSLFIGQALRFFVGFLVVGTQTRGASLVFAWVGRRVQRRLIWASGLWV